MVRRFVAVEANGSSRLLLCVRSTHCTSRGRGDVRFDEMSSRTPANAPQEIIISSNIPVSTATNVPMSQRLARQPRVPRTSRQ
jgi:hypothetical protein